MIVQPHYDRVACLFNWPHAVHGDEVYVVKVDCGIEVRFCCLPVFSIAENCVWVCGQISC